MTRMGRAAKARPLVLFDSQNRFGLGLHLVGSPDGTTVAPIARRRETDASHDASVVNPSSGYVTANRTAPERREPRKQGQRASLAPMVHCHACGVALCDNNSSLTKVGHCSGNAEFFAQQAIDFIRGREEDRRRLFDLT